MKTPETYMVEGWMKTDVPEVRENFRILAVQVQSQRHHQQNEESREKSLWQRSQVKKPEISSANTTLIGDYIATVFPEYSKTWLVQAQGNATFDSVVSCIEQELVMVDRKYIFIHLGGNQILSADNEKVFNRLVKIIMAIRQHNSQCYVYFLGVLPKPIDNENCKTSIAKFNRWLSHGVEKAQKIFQKIKFLPVQLSFLQGNVPKDNLYNQQDRMTLSQLGVKVFKCTAFELAGFIKNM